jgi:MFS family permease
VINTFLTGPWVDRFTAVKLFPYYQFPMALGFLILGLGQNSWAAPLSFLLSGFSVGSGGPIKSAIWAELYGVKHLGAIKSSFATLMVLSTAASPALFGWILDRSQSSAPLMLILTFLCLVSSALAGWGIKLSRP